MQLTVILALAFIVSLDGLAAGVTYGARKIKLPLVAVCLISVTSAMTMGISMSIGSTLRYLISEGPANMAGAVLLILLGVYSISQQHRSSTRSADTEKDILHVRIASLGLVIRVWHDPLLADRDNSGGINAAEAIVLGVALALDAFVAGLGAAVLGLPPVFTAVAIGTFKFLLVNLGLYAGGSLARVLSPQVMSLLPGLLLIVMGVGHLL